MNILTVETDNVANARKLAAFLKTIGYIKSVNIDNVPLKPLTGSDWIKPGRPATEDEHEQMLNEAEESPSMLAEEAEEYSRELIEKWNKEKK